MPPIPPESLDLATLENVGQIVDITLAALPNDAQPFSVILSGGFARNESGHYVCNDRLLPFGDYDFDIVVPRPLLDSEEREVHRTLFEELRFQPVTAKSEPTLVEDPDRFNVLDLRFKTREEWVERVPDLSLYDLCDSYCVLHGQDVVAEIPEVALSDISPFSPWRILGNRIVLALNHFTVEFWDRSPTRHEALALRLAVCRTYLDLAGILVFLHGSYRTSYRERLDQLRACPGLWQNWFPDHEAVLNRMEKALSFKKSPSLEAVSGESIRQEWFDLVWDLGRAFPHLTNLVLLSADLPLERIRNVLSGTEEAGRTPGAIENPFKEDWRALVLRQTRLYPSLFYKDFISAHLRRKGKRVPYIDFCSKNASRFYGLYEHLVWRGWKWVRGNLRRATLSPPAFQSAMLPLILFSLTPTRQVNAEAFELFDKMMNPYLPMVFDHLEPLQRWEASRRCLVFEMLDYRRKR